MVFSAVIFVFCFLPVTLIASFLLPHRAQNAFLLAASLAFYAWGETAYVLLMLASITLNYGLGRALESLRRPRLRLAVTALGVLLNLAPLCFFKYTHFLLDAINSLSSHWGGAPLAMGAIHLPIGISFFTFQAISYLVDVYRGDAEAQRNPLNVALYIAFFPQLIAGPIVRYQDIARQLVDRVRTAGGVVAGLQRFTIGLAKKVLIANTLAVPADAIFGLGPENVSFSVAWLGIACYTLQLYFDFSGYSDMAIGLGQLFGFRFPENFNYPYISQSIREFWRRWHISLSTWFRDYLYIPLGGSRRRTALNLAIVFFLCGLWHGASWTFVVWGLYHGGFLLLERYGAARLQRPVPRPVRHGYAMLVVVIGWVFFRADTLTEAGYFLRAMAGLPAAGEWAHPIGYYFNREVFLALLAGAACATPLGTGAWRRFRALPYLRLPAQGLEMAAALALLALCCVVLSAQTYNPFIYFRF